jgi:hypothetical protein
VYVALWPSLFPVPRHVDWELLNLRVLACCKLSRTAGQLVCRQSLWTLVVHLFLGWCTTHPSIKWGIYLLPSGFGILVRSSVCVRPTRCLFVPAGLCGLWAVSCSSLDPGDYRLYPRSYSLEPGSWTLEPREDYDGYLPCVMPLMTAC